MKTTFSVLLLASIGMLVHAAVIGDMYSDMCKTDRTPEEYPYICFNSLDGPVQRVGEKENDPALYVSPTDSTRKLLFAFLESFLDVF